MLRIRMVEEAIAHHYSEQKMRCPTHLSIGQEACAVGVSAMLTKDDKAFSSHRAHAHYLAKGGDLNKLIAELYGKATGCTGGRGGSMHLSDLDAGFVASTAIVANSIPVATGQALHQQLQRQNNLTVAYFGDGATEEGAFYESVNFAAVRKLPILYVCENNQYSVYSGLRCRQPQGRSITGMSKSMGLFALEGDGHNLESVLQIAEQAVKWIRDGNGPALIELHTYRYREHCGPNFDDDLGYRPAGEMASWQAKDPLLQLEATFANEANWAATKAAMVSEIEAQIEAAFTAAEQAPFPNPEHNELYVYAE
ncbi:thiamine pyrophosphate-dependent dehydrogenase E1 component subunit alpha [Alteromonas sp. RKMC-009]|nr:thiamine pyrophosphate-dependent dehydrogenase E1 component subunit alpha [Alteromonas sp. RKMC-009]